MEKLLRDNFTTHYKLAKCTTPDLVMITNKPYFEIEDDKDKNIILYTNKGSGEARFSNPTQLEIMIANYDKFLSSLPSGFQHGKKRCDLIVTSYQCDYFILGELKNSVYIEKRREKAKDQLYDTLNLIIDVPQISSFINTKTVKRCCYFNKQSEAPATINATIAFNRLSTVIAGGIKMSFSEVEAHGFEFWEYTGEQTLEFENI